MANYWYYAAYTREPRPFSTSEVDSMLESFRSLGYFVEENQWGLPVWRLHDTNWMFLQERLDFLTTLATEGGMVKLWQSLDPDEADIDLDVSFLPSNGVRLGTVQIGVRDSLFRDGELRISAAENTRQLFGGLCGLLGSEYGWSADENTIEVLLGAYSATEIFTEQLIVPTSLFWLNYFSTGLFSKIGELLLQHFDCDVAPTPDGFLVSFFDHPWNVDIAVLRTVNERWRALTFDW